MILPKNILYVLSLLTVYCPLTMPIRNKNLVVTKSGIEDVSACSIGLQFFSMINNTSDDDYIVELISDECCIKSGDTLDCDSVEIIGETADVIQKGKVKTFTLVAPVLDPFERKGYCTIHVDSRPIDKRNIIMRDTIKIEFDTGLKTLNATANLDESVRKCRNEDEDPLNDCKPVNCDTYYNGKKPLFDRNTRRCIEVPKCKEKISGENKIYDPITNRCVDGENIDIKDIDYIKSITHERQPKDVIIVESISNDTQKLLTEEMLSPLPNNTATTSTKKQNLLSIYVQKLFTINKYTMIVLGTVFFSQCVLICIMIYCLTKMSTDSEKKVERKYFNYRQDASVTTPLITTSNIDTETAACEFISESTSLDKRIKCYKACQKEKNNDAKFSMSDDILLKCLNRRNWNTRAKSDTENNIQNFNEVTNFGWQTENDKQTVQEMTNPEQYTIENIQHEKSIDFTNEASQNVYESRKIKEDYTDNDSSEKLIQCHDYNMVQTRKKRTTEKTETKNTAASIVSAEKGAQANFSNDSADDFLSERGMILLTGDGISRFSFPSDSTPKSSLITSTSKTSKNNILKNVLSYLSRKSKIVTTSDPGEKKSKEKDLELLHMSQASMYSSSASEYRNLHRVKLAKSSRTSF